jgi:hypothetical protein
VAKDELIERVFLVYFGFQGATQQHLPRVLFKQGFYLTIISSTLSYVAF